MAEVEVPPAPPDSFRAWLSGLLSVTLLLLLADGVLAVVARGLFLAGLGRPLHAVTLPVFILSFLAGTAVYTLMGFTNAIPKRIFVPMTLFSTIVLLALLPVLIYHPAWLSAVLMGSALIQIAVALAAWAWARGGLSWGWPLVPKARLRPPGFSGGNLALFTVANLLFLAATIGYLGLCAGMAVDHFSAHFLILHSDRLEVRSKTYVRDDGKTVTLLPMIHIGTDDFYRQVEALIPPSAIILREGVSDRRGLLARKLDYAQAAQALGLSDQRQSFTPPPERSRMADVDVSDFSPTTLAMIDIVSEIYAEGWTPDAIPALRHGDGNPRLLDMLVDDLLVKRNAHVLSEMDRELLTADQVALPWGVAHMPGLEAALRKEGFRLGETHTLSAIPLDSIFARLRETVINSLTASQEP